MSRSRSNNGTPFYVDVGTSFAAIRCASNHDVLMRYNHSLCPHSLNFAKGMCDRMNREVEFGRPLRNCDVGTAEEQNNRFMRFCDNVSMKYCWGRECSKCIFHWLQMPYKKGGTK